MVKPAGRRLALMSVLGIFLLGALAYVLGIVFEADYPYYFTIRQAEHATTPDGRSVSEIIARVFPNRAFRWHCCSYYADLVQLPGVTTMWLEVAGAEGSRGSPFYFAFHRRTNSMVLLSQDPDHPLKECQPRDGTAELMVVDGVRRMVPYQWQVKR